MFGQSNEWSDNVGFAYNHAFCHFCSRCIVIWDIPTDYNKSREVADLKDQIAVWKTRHEVQERYHFLFPTEMLLLRAALKEKDESMTYQALNAELQEQNSQLRAVMMNKNHLLEELKEQPQHV